jgi:hypothetical protein
MRWSSGGAQHALYRVSISFKKKLSTFLNRIG